MFNQIMLMILIILMIGLSSRSGSGAGARSGLARRFVQDPAALFAVDDFFSRFDCFYRRGGQLHVATGADTVLHRDDRGVTLAFKQTLEAAEQVLVQLAGKLTSLFRQLL